MESMEVMAAALCAATEEVDGPISVGPAPNEADLQSRGATRRNALAPIVKRRRGRAGGTRTPGERSDV
jgi:hypothetical protein